jgi:diguanylate cyclase (GGDEF)-like protein
MATPNKSSEKRRHKRVGTNVEAVMAIGDKSTIQCVILDFSEQGLFLHLKDPSVIGLQKGKNAKIYFSAETGGGKEYFQIDAQIARVVDDGIGVVFENISESMFKALTQSTNVGSIAAYSSNPRFFLTSSNQDKFKEDFRILISNILPKLMNEFFDDAQDELEKTPDYAENFKDVAAQANLISVLRMNKAQLIASYSRAINADLDFTGFKEDSQDGLNDPSSNLSLVEKEVFEDWLNYSTLIRKVNTQFKNQLYQLELKLSYVTCFPRYLIKNPIAPERLCECFRKEIASIEDSVVAKRSLYKAFLTTLYDHLPSLYQAFEALLTEHGAPRNTAQDIVWKKNFPTNTNPKSDDFTDTFSSGHQLPSFDNDAYHYSDPSYSLDAPTLSTPLGRQGRSGLQKPVSQTATKLFNLMNQGMSASHTQLADTTHSALGGSSTQFAGPEYSPDELLSALTKLQASKALAQMPQDASSLLQAQLSESLSTTEYFGTKSFSAEDKTKLDVYDQLFQALLNELTLNPNIKSYVETIKLPLMALTLQDPKFLDSENHPARNLLNQLFSLDSAVNQNKVIKNTQIKQILDQLMSKIAQGSITNPDIFAKANEELKELSGPIARSKEANIRRVVEVYEGKQKLEKARKKIQQAIDNRIEGKTIPRVIQTLLDSGWQHLLVITELNDEREERQRYFEAIDELLAWYHDLDKIPEQQYSIIEIELEFINDALGPVCTNAFVHNKIMEELHATLVGTGTPRLRKPIDTAFISSKAPEPPNEFVSDRWYLEVDQFEVGDWFTFSLEKEAFEPLKLIWIGELPQNYVFVNRDGYKKQDITHNELAELLQSGVVTKIENLDEPVMDRATTTMLQQMQEKLIHSVSHDPITNLPNRKRFISLIKEQITRQNQSEHVICYLEIEDFRIITNVCGLAGGDQLILQVSDFIKNNLGKNGIVSRIGDKTFGFLVQDCTSDEGQETAKQIRDQINKSNFIWEDKSFTVSVNMGLVPVIEGGMHNVEELLQKADSLLISAKRTGHNRIRVYQENDETLKTQMDIHEWAGRIDRIFAEKRLFARCQMIAPIDTEKNDHSHYEILLGVRGEDGKIIPPDNFIPAVERCQRMPEIDRWVVENVFGWIVDNRESFDKIGGFAINLSGQSLNSEEFLNYLKDRLMVQDVPAEKITFEVTETVAAGSLVFTKRFIKEIKHFGCKFSLDDFGTGYSSYSYLKSLDVDYLKIDGSFIKDIANSPTDVVMVNSMNEIAHSLELETIAEYVENMTIHAILKEIGVDYAQGWGIHKPMPLAELRDALNR